VRHAFDHLWRRLTTLQRRERGKQRAHDDPHPTVRIAR
jgi:hypothetical protein